MMYKGEALREISFPLGGIGTGCIGLSGDGSLTDWEIFNRPSKGSRNGYSFIAIRAEYPDGKAVCRVLQGDLRKEFTGRFGKSIYNCSGHGAEKIAMYGFPHFRDVTFDGAFPIARLTFSDPCFPGSVIMTAYNPMIPNDALASSLPAAFFRITVRNEDKRVKYMIAFCVSNPADKATNIPYRDTVGSGVFLKDSGHKENETEYRDLTIFAADGNASVQSYWYRGGWQDGITTFWREFEKGVFREREYKTPGSCCPCTVSTRFTLAPGKEKTTLFILSWNSPNCCNYWHSVKDGKGRDRTWKNYYATVFPSSLETALYAADNEETLFTRTVAFKDALFSSTLDPAVIDAVSASLSVLKSPTVLRLEDGSIYGWEGVHETSGSCEGTCTHVWSYAYSLCFLFPELERSIRDNEAQNTIGKDGYMQFRMPLPKGCYYPIDDHACVDGQMATVFKYYREWKISGDTGWLKKAWPEIKRCIGYAWSEKNPDGWDRNRDGVLEGRQHHTLDMQLFGPSSWLEGMYLAALKAASIMAGALGDKKAEREYAELFSKGRTWMEKHLFNGSYYYHLVDLKDKDTLKKYNALDYWNEESDEIKYQIASGCEIDQMLGQWHAAICGLGDIFDPVRRRTALRSMMANNFKRSMREFVNPWRIYAVNDDAGTIICDYPKNVEKPAIPIPYCEETMHGFEYAFAGLLVSEGMIKDALRVVRAVRARYDGKHRNPWNEIECGNNYARSMAAFALLPLFSGFEYDLVTKRIGFSPKLKGDYRCLFSLDNVYGTLERKGASAGISVCEGWISLRELKLPFAGKVRTLSADGKKLRFSQHKGVISFDEITVKDSLRCEW